jgi:GNAT superfamily N-acetyltransferase/precorrin-6B methylase 2
MSWLHERHLFRSDKNGVIVAKRFFGTWEITVDGYDQSSSYIKKMWQEALARLPEYARAKRVLLLGLGAGSIIDDLHRRFPNCQVTVIEWDPEMITLAKRLHLFKPEHAPQVLVGDALEMLPTLDQTFDLIVFDLYRGERPEPRLAEADFQKQLQSHLKHSGFLLANVFKTPTLLEATDRFFSREQTWHFRFNTLALYRPQSYSTYRAEEGYLRRHADGKLNGVFIQTPSVDERLLIPGLRWKRGPLRFEGYFSDDEPACDPDAPRRLVIWQPLRPNVIRPKTWWRFPLPVNVRRTGHVEISDPAEYWKDWNENVRRQRAKWLKAKPLAIEEVSLDDFVAGYREARPWFRMRDMFVKQLRERIVLFPGLVTLLGARDPATGQIRAGFATLDIPECGASIHLTSFFHPQFRRTGVGTALVDAWFRRAIAHNIRYLDFDIFWVFGEPREWKGFSKFKSQFGTRFVDYPPPFLKIVGGKSLR